MMGSRVNYSYRNQNSLALARGRHEVVFGPGAIQARSGEVRCKNLCLLSGSTKCVINGAKLPGHLSQLSFHLVGYKFKYCSTNVKVDPTAHEITAVPRVSYATNQQY